MTNGISNVPYFTPIFRQKTAANQDEQKNTEKLSAAEAERQAREEAAKKILSQQKNELSMLEEQLKNSNEQAEAAGDSFEAFSKCLTIAQRITRGDIVPLKDIKYLMEHEPDLYKQAILMRRPNDDPEKHDSVLEDEDEEARTDETSSSDSHSSSDTTSEAPAVSEVTAPAAEATVTE